MVDDSRTVSLDEYKRVCDENEKLRDTAKTMYEVLDSMLVIMSVTEGMECNAFFLTPLVVEANHRLRELGVETSKLGLMFVG